MTEHERSLDYHALNAMLNMYDAEGKIQFDKEALAVRRYFLDHVNQNTVFFHSLREKLDYLVEEGYYEKAVLDQYSFEFIKSLNKRVYGKKFRFKTFFGAFKYYTSYTLKTFDGKKYLERYEDRICMTALTLARGDEQMAIDLAEEMIGSRYQPATPTFLNSGKVARGELVSCFILRVEDNMESIARASAHALQLSKRGGGVAINLTNLRETGAPIKRIAGQSSGVLPVMKKLDIDFSYANQLGARPGAGAVYLSIHHPDLLAALDTKRENADERIRIKTLSIGIVVTDAAMEAAAKNENLYQFSPYDVERFYGKAMSDISITEKYDEMLLNPEIRKYKVNARKIFETIAEIQFQSGYPYIMYEDTVNRANPVAGRVSASNLCSEILQVSTPSKLNSDLSYEEIGNDISCNLGSLNIALTMDSPDFGKTVETSIRALTAVSEMSRITPVPSVVQGNEAGHSIGLGQMNLHGFLARERIHYGSPESVDFTNIYFYTVLYHCLRASNKLAQEKGRYFTGFMQSDYAPNGHFFDKYTLNEWKPKHEVVAKLFADRGIHIPTQEDWFELRDLVWEYGIYNQYLQAVPPTGSISYINHSTSSIHPITSKIEIRKEGQTGRAYYPAPFMTNDNLEYYKDAYEIGAEKIIDVYAAATQHVDQGLSLTLFFMDTHTTRDVNKAQIYAFSKNIKTIYYIRIRQQVLEGTEVEGCVSCQL